MFSNYIKFVFLLIVFITIFISIFFIPITTNGLKTEARTTSTPVINSKFDISNSNFSWPIPGYTRISSPFGRRISPTGGASSYHLGIDIPAPPGTNLIAPCDSIVNFIGFKGSGGYTISLKCNDLEFIYHHVSPQYIVNVGDYITNGKIVGKVRT